MYTNGKSGHFRSPHPGTLAKNSYNRKPKVGEVGETGRCLSCEKITISSGKWYS